MQKHLTPTRIFSATIALIVLTLAYGIHVEKIGAGLNEKSFATVFSVALLWMTSRTCFKINRFKTEQDTHATGSSDARVIWLFLGYSFAYLALDELLQIHENIDKFIHYVSGMEETGWSDRIDDLILLIYGVVGLVVLFIYRAEILTAPHLLRFLRLAFLFAVVSLVVDAVSTNEGYLASMQIDESLHRTVKGWVKLLEESTKLLAGAALLSGFNEVLRAIDHTSGDRNAIAPIEN